MAFKSLWRTLITLKNAVQLEHKVSRSQKALKVWFTLSKFWNHLKASHSNRKSGRWNMKSERNETIYSSYHELPHLFSTRILNFWQILSVGMKELKQKNSKEDGRFTQVTLHLGMPKSEE